MRALIFVKPGCLEWQERADPQLLEPADAIVRPLASTICDLDALIIRGRTPFAGPFAIGHECIAEVIETGDAVSRVRVGDRVIVHWHVSCGHCQRCGDGRPNSCTTTSRVSAGYGLPGIGDYGGMFSDLLRIPFADHGLTLVPSDVDPTLIASAADNLAFGYEYTVPHLQAQPGAPVLIVGGCGSIALYAVAYATAAGASEVTYLDQDPTRLAIAAGYGAKVMTGAPPKRAGSFPIVVDASATSEGLLCALRSIEPEGIVSSVGGHFGEVALPLFEMYLRGTRFYTGRGRGAPNVLPALAWVQDGRVDPRPIISEIADFDDAPSVLANPSLKPVLTRVALTRRELA